MFDICDFVCMVGNVFVGKIVILEVLCVGELIEVGVMFGCCEIVEVVVVVVVEI